MRIVVGYDGSDPAKRALQRTADLAGNADRVVVVAAAEPHARTGIVKGAHLDPSESSSGGAIWRRRSGSSPNGESTPSRSKPRVTPARLSSRRPRTPT